MSRSQSRRYRPALHALESRTVPAVLTVTTTLDLADKPALPAGGLSLRAAILQANATPEADTVVLPAGRYTLALPGREESQGRTGDLNVVGTLTIQGAGAATTIIDANGLDRVLSIAANGSQDSNVTVVGVTLTGGRTDVALNPSLPDGAGILLVNSTLNLTSSAVVGNASGREGGGIAVRDSRLNLTASTLSGNTAGRDGGGISLSGGNDPARNASVSIVNSTVSDNTAVRSGGGVKLFSPDGTKSSLNAVNVTLFANGASAGGNISNTAQNALGIGGSVTLTNTIVAGATAGGDYDAPTGVTSLGGNLEDGDSLKLRQPSDQFLVDSGVGPLKNNGGTTATRALSATSAARDKAIASLAPATDQVGNLRPQGGSADIGAFESIPSAAPPAAPATPGVPGTPAAPVVPLAKVSTQRLTAVGAARGSSQVNVYNSDGAQRAAFDAFPGFRGGVRVATGDFDGDGTDDILVGAGPGGGPHVEVFDGKTFAVIASFFAFDPGFNGGIELAAGDLDGDGKAEIVASAGPGGGPHVKVFHGGDLTTLASFFAFDPAFRGGITAAIDPVAKTVVVGAGAGGGPQVNVYDGSTFALRNSFFAFDPSFTGGVSLAAVNNVIAVGVLSSASSEVRLFSPAGSVIDSFRPFESTFVGGVRLAAGGTAAAPTFVVGAAGLGGPAVRTYTTAGVFDSTFLAFDPLYNGGVTVG